ncbi:Homeobox-leucine zipper protein protodermal factor [Thalictrum thalictroides]|uniref:Homeobox-leucine zipper protein protodermal factor n=1 Tax=Thalictrum thalictroides TaxID=46969 RepID=A0A7J6W9A6_THATH|nr:Homeobox-leucine zipper protein protodermal factor [Thalictrum thalictroides]
MHNIATAAMDEFMKITQVKDLFVFPSTDGSSKISIEEYEGQAFPKRMTDLLALPSYVGSAEINVEGYERTFPRRMAEKPSEWKTELSRETGCFPINHLKLLDILLNVESWSTMFSAIVARAEQIEVLSTGSSETFNGMLQLVIELNSY